MKWVTELGLPYTEGIATFTALQRRGIPSELLYLPTENHHCLNPQNSLVWHHAVLSWIKKHTAFRTYFMRRNTVPLDFGARPFPEYERKLRRMLRSIDRGHRPAEADACQAANEPWLD